MRRRRGVVRRRRTPDPRARCSQEHHRSVTLADTETEALLRDRLAQLRPARRSSRGGRRPRARCGRRRVVGARPDRRNGELSTACRAYAVSVAAQVDGCRWRARWPTWWPATSTAAAGLGADVFRRRRAQPTALQHRRRPVDGPGGHRIRLRGAAAAEQAALLARILPVVRDVRRIGSAALDLCLVAAGRPTPTTSTGCMSGTGGGWIATEAARCWVNCPSPTRP